MTIEKKPEIVAIVGKSGSGKTTLLEKLIPVLKGRGYRLGIVKHVFHGFEMDKKGKDSWRHKQAGAAATLVLTAGTVAMVKDVNEPSLLDMTAYLSDMDLIIAEGFKGAAVPKIEVFRKDGPHREPLFLGGNQIVALVTDTDHRPFGVPVFGLDDMERLADFLEIRFLTGE
ncbi:MAG: molybdopterin-guanine dinucleotide biosynthesis protein B [Pseudomonadota bacterium]